MSAPRTHREGERRPLGLTRKLIRRTACGLYLDYRPDVRLVTGDVEPSCARCLKFAPRAEVRP